MRASTVPVLFITLCCCACTRLADAPPTPTIVAVAPVPVPMAFSITLGPGDAPLTGTVRPHRIAWDRTDQVINLANSKVMLPIYEALRLRLATVWQTAPKEVIPQVKDRRWATLPVELHLTGRVDCLLVNEVLQIAIGGYNPIQPASSGEEPPCFKTIRIIDGHDVFVFPIAVSDAKDPHVVEPLQDINVRLLPAGTRPGLQPSGYDKAWKTRPGATTEIRARLSEPGPLLLDQEQLAAEDAHLINGYRKSLGTALKTMLPAALPPQAPFVIHCFSHLPWCHARLVHDLLRAIDGEREIFFAPSRIRGYHAWEVGNEIWELVHLK